MIAVTAPLLRSWPIEQPASDDSKEERGRVLVIGGEREIPGAVLLSGIASLRAGAGKLQVATCESAATHIGVAIPEARVIGLGETDNGAIRGDSADHIVEALEKSDALLIGPGMTDERETNRLVRDLLPHAGKRTVVLDAGALASLGGDLFPPAREFLTVITPHAGEMAAILGEDIAVVRDDPAACAQKVAETLAVIVVLKGAETHIVDPGGQHYVYRGGDVGLATSGSGDILAGVIAGLAARTEDPLQAAVFGVFVHGEAGNTLAKKSGRVGYLARELLLQISPIVNRFTGSF
jgi:hydroxyethylthiazole kinase-like uncharacterized protein yjeF